MLEITARHYLNIFFSNASNDIVTLDDIYRSAGRDLSDSKNNRTWLGNKLISLKHYNYVKPIYSKKNSSLVLDKIQLTDIGKRELLRIESSSTNDTASKGIVEDTLQDNRPKAGISLTEVMEMITELKKRDKGNIEMDIKLKEGIVSVRLLRD